ncbi:MAG: flagellar filament capping protein FliD [Bacillota bacterium]
MSYLSIINRVAGLASGMDTDQMVKDLMKVARIPLDRMLQKKQTLLWKQADYRTINQALVDFRSNYALKMKLQGTYLAKTATSADTTAVTATASSSAQALAYNLTVNSLAGVGRLYSDTFGASFDPDEQLSSSVGLAGPTSFQIVTYKTDELGAEVEDATLTINVDPTDTLNDVLNEIETQTAGEISAVYEPLTDRILLSTSRTGQYSDNKYKIVDSNWFLLDNLKFTSYFTNPGDSEEILTGSNADVSITIDGLPDVVTHTPTENSFALNGVTFNLLKTTASAVKVTVSQDVDEVVDTITTFVEEFNSLISTINNELNETRYSDYLPLTDEQKEELTDTQIEQWEEKAKSGLLRSDSILFSGVSELRRALTTAVSGLTTGFDSIFGIGFSTGYYFEGGKLYVDETKLREAISTNPDAVMRLFTADDDAYTYEQQGIGVRLYDEVNKLADRLTDEAGYPSTFSLFDESYIAESIRDLEDRISDTEDRLTTLEERYWRQFTAMEQAIAQFNTQSAWLTKQSQGG